MTTSDLTLRFHADDGEYAVYVLRLMGMLGPDESLGPEDLEIAVCFVRDELFVENAVKNLERFYSGEPEDERPKVVTLPVRCVDELQEPICSWCGSQDLVSVASFGTTGVRSPDGICETQSQTGFWCQNCGRIQET